MFCKFFHFENLSKNDFYCFVDLIISGQMLRACVLCPKKVPHRRTECIPRLMRQNQFLFRHCACACAPRERERKSWRRNGPVSNCQQLAPGRPPAHTCPPHCPPLRSLSCFSEATRSVSHSSTARAEVSEQFI